MMQRFFFLALFVSIISMQCSNQTAGIETTNGATVAVAGTTVSGTGPVYARVSVYDSAYIPAIDSGFARATATDDSGHFSFDSLPTGVYTIIIESSDKSHSATFANVAIGSQERVYEKTLEPAGTISGSVNWPNDSGSVLVYLVGTGYYMIMPQRGNFRFEKIPPGEYALQVCTVSLNGGAIKPVIISPQNRKPVVVFAARESIVGSIALQ